LQLADAGIEVAADMLDGEIDHLRIELRDERPDAHREQDRRGAVAADDVVGAICDGSHETSRQ
jgi:hypothetical protein